MLYDHKYKASKQSNKSNGIDCLNIFWTSSEKAKIQFGDAIQWIFQIYQSAATPEAATGK